MATASEQGFQVRHEALTLATQALPDQVTALGTIRQNLGVRQVPAEAFANVGASALAGAGHTGNIADTATMLDASAGRLRGINDAVYGSRQAVEQWDRQQAKKQKDQLLILAQAEEARGQRQQAVDELRRIAQREPISVAAVALPAVDRLHRWAGEFQAGQIGDHYRYDVNDILHQPPTDANLRRLADVETEFWRSDRGSTAGALMSADWRYEILTSSRESWLAGFPPAEQAHLRDQLGLPSR